MVKVLAAKGKSRGKNSSPHRVKRGSARRRCYSRFRACFVLALGRNQSTLYNLQVRDTLILCSKRTNPSTMSDYRFLATYQDAACSVTFDHVPSVNEVRDAIAMKMALKFVPALKYVDPEDDLVTIDCASDLEEAMKLVSHHAFCSFL